MVLSAAEALVRAWALRQRLVDSVDFFGSRVRGTCHAGSDLDIAITFIYSEVDTCLAYWFENSDLWQRELQSLLPWTVDLQFHHPEAPGIVSSGVAQSSHRVFRRDA